MEKNKVLNNPHSLFIALIIIVLAITYYYCKANLGNINLTWLRDIIIFEYLHKINGSFFIIPFIYATLKYWWKGALVTSLISESVMLPYIVHMASSLEGLIDNVFYFLVPILIVGFIALEFQLRRKDKIISAERETEHQSYTSQIFKAQEDERYRIAQELHDDALQMLCLIADRAYALENGDNIPNINQIKGEAGWIRSSIIKVAESIRRVSIDLRPTILDDLSIVQALRWLIDRLNQNGGSNIQLSIVGIERKLSREAEITIFRIIQEAINNTRKHANATVVLVNLEFGTDSCKIIVRDNGKGFYLPKKISNLVTNGKLGLIGMQQRAEFLGGSLNINSKLGEGTTISIEVRV